MYTVSIDNDNTNNNANGYPTDDEGHQSDVSHAPNHQPPDTNANNINTQDIRDLRATINTLQTQLNTYSERRNQATDRVFELQAQNNRLQIDLMTARQTPPAPPPPPPQQHPQPPQDQAILQQLLAAQQAATAAQEEANRLREQARRDRIREKEESIVSTFPNFKSFDDIKTWYQKLVSVISQPRFSQLYDAHTSDIVDSGAHLPALNSALYSEILNNCGKEVETYILSKDHLRNDDIALIWNIYNSYNPTWSALKIRAKTTEWKQTRMDKTESIEDFFTRCLTARKDLIANGVFISEDNLRTTFIMGLTAHFTSIQEKLDDLPQEWLDPDIHKLPKTAKKF